MKKAVLIMIFFIALSTIPCHAKTMSPDTFKVIGYYSEVFNEPVDALQFDKLTHIIYAFAIPKSDGSILPLEKPEKLKALVEKAHQHNVKVCIAVGGWSYKDVPLNVNFESLASSAKTRQNFINTVVLMLEEYQLDGIELDWEYPLPGLSDAHYETLVIELDKAIKPLNKTLSVSVAGSWSVSDTPTINDAISAKSLKRFNWINVMSYDINKTQHAPYSHAETSILYWLNRNVPAEKIILGLPLYAQPSWKQYRHIVKENPEYALKDHAQTTPLESWYNGIPTIKEKTRLALLNAGGVMLFDINEDTSDDTSLLSAIDTVKKEAAKDFAKFQQTVKCTIEGKDLNFDPSDNLGAPFIDPSGRTLMPVRKPLEHIGATVDYIPEKNIVKAILGTKTLIIPLASNIISLDGNPIVMDTQAIIKDNRLYIPLRYVFEAFNYSVDWHSGSKTATVTIQK